MSPTQDTLSRLLELANKASPGPWSHCMSYISAPAMREDGKGGSSFHVAMIRGWGHLQYLGEKRAIDIQEANGEFIAAANPLVVTALVESLLESMKALQIYISIPLMAGMEVESWPAKETLAKIEERLGKL